MPKNEKESGRRPGRGDATPDVAPPRVDTDGASVEPARMPTDNENKARAYTVFQIRALLNQPALLNVCDAYAGELGFKGSSTVADYDLKSPDQEMIGYKELYKRFAAIGHTPSTIGNAASVRVAIERRSGN